MLPVYSIPYVIVCKAPGMSWVRGKYSRCSGFKKTVHRAVYLPFRRVPVRFQPDRTANPDILPRP